MNQPIQTAWLNQIKQPEPPASFDKTILAAIQSALLTENGILNKSITKH